MLTANSIANGFNTLEITGVPVGQKLVSYKTATGIFLTLTSEFTYAAWAASKGLVPPDNDPNDDPDGDKVVNAFEALLGGNPNVFNLRLMPPPVVVGVTGTNYLAVALNRDASVFITDLAFGANRSTNLSTWSNTNVILHSQTFNAQQGTEVFLYRSLAPYASQPKEFLRLQSQLIPP